MICRFPHCHRLATAAGFCSRDRERIRVLGYARPAKIPDASLPSIAAEWDRRDAAFRAWLAIEMPIRMAGRRAA